MVLVNVLIAVLPILPPTFHLGPSLPAIAIGHFYGGIPSGPMGLVATGGVSLLLGRAMIETRGLVWPIALHFSIDLVIFMFLGIASGA